MIKITLLKINYKLLFLDVTWSKEQLFLTIQLMKYYWSKYNHIFKNNDKEYVLYNSLSNAIIILSETEHKELNKLEKLSVIPESQIDSDLIRAKVFVENDNVAAQEFLLRRKVDRKQNLLDLYIYPTLKCNFSCQYCYQDEVVKTTMSVETIELLILFIKSKIEEIKPKGIGITWIGGEPLLESDMIVSINERITNELALINKEILIDNMLVTNGYLINKALDIGLFEKVKFGLVQITIDGIEDTHNSRRSPLNKGSYNVILNNLELLLEELPEIKIAIRTNVDKTNMGEFPKLFYSLKKRFKGENIKVIPSFVEDYSTVSCELCNVTLSKSEQGQYFLELYNKYGIVCTDFHPKISTYSCMAKVDNSFAIGPNGYVYKCATLVGKEQHSLFNLREPDIINYKFLNDFFVEVDYLNKEECIECNLFPVCDGGCSIHRLKEKSFNVEMDHCLVAKNNLEEFIKAHIIIKQKNYEKN